MSRIPYIPTESEIRYRDQLRARLDEALFNLALEENLVRLNEELSPKRVDTSAVKR